MQDSQQIFGRDYYYGQKNSNYHDYSRYDNDRYWRPFLNAIKKVSAGGRLLDVGCAFGYFLKRARPFYAEINGIDISEFAIQKAKEQIPNVNLQVVNLDTDALPFSDNYFDCITAFDILEHTRSIENALAKLKSKLKPSGYIICSVPIRDTWAGKIFHIYDKDITHHSVPTKAELDEIISNSGLKLVNKKAFINAVFLRIPFIPVDFELTLQKLSDEYAKDTL